MHRLCLRVDDSRVSAKVELRNEINLFQVVTSFHRSPLRNGQSPYLDRTAPLRPQVPSPLRTGSPTAARMISGYLKQAEVLKDNTSPSAAQTEAEHFPMQENRNALEPLRSRAERRGDGFSTDVALRVKISTRGRAPLCQIVPKKGRHPVSNFAAPRGPCQSSGRAVCQSVRKCQISAGPGRSP